MTAHSEAELEAAAEYYLEQLRGGDFDEAFQGLIDLDPAILRPLIAAYHAETSRDVRSGLLRILWEFRLPAVLPLLEEALRDRRDDRWKNALDGLVTLASPGSVRVLERVIADELAASNPDSVYVEWVREALEQAQRANERVMRTTCVDHLVWATPDLEAGVREIERLTGVRASPGGKHPSWATHNALLSLGPGIYLELLAPDPSAPPPSKARPFGLDQLSAPRLVTWAAQEADLEGRLAALAMAGTDLGEILSGGRVRPDGVALAWRLTSPRAMLEGGVVPFLIDWGSSPHPSTTAAPGLTLVALELGHPEPDKLRQLLEPFGVDLSIRKSPQSALVATLDSPRGRVELR